MRLAALALVAILATGCARTSLPTAAMRTGVVAAASVDPLATKLQALYAENFAKLDTDADGAWTAKELELSGRAFKQLLGAFDQDHDGQVTLKEYFPPARLKKLESDVRSRAEVSASGVGGRVNLPKGKLMFDVYLQDRMPEEAVRTWAIAEAFHDADTDKTGMLKASELEVALAILEARADFTDLQRRMTQAIDGGQ
ncbi:MAG: hypothetical protein JWM80_6429 [Cyanobacteria bacterium RYN_339]|nr:hypothetical protein [Cyanobacteria bacterium RYN_339]